MPLTRREFLSRSSSAAMAAALARLGPAEAARPMPNLVWLMTDQQPCNTLHAYGNAVARTPLTDRLAAQGTRLDNFLLSAFPCGPSRACLFTGRECHSTAVTRNDVTLPADVPSLAELLAGAGYQFGYFGKWHLSGNMYRMPSRGPNDGQWQYVRKADAQGFEYEQVPGGTGEDAACHGFATWAGGWTQYHEWLRANGQGALLEKRLFGNHNILPSVPEGQHMHSLVPAEYHVESFIAQQAAAFIRSRAASPQPFGAVVSFYGPHLPVAPPQPWDELFSLEQASLPPNHLDRLDGKPLRQRQNTHCYQLDRWHEGQFRDYVRRYWGYVSYIEQCAQQVLDALQATGRADDTIVLWTTDHGDMVAAHGMIYKLGACGYEELLRVPMLLSYPGVVRAGAASDALCATVDVVPTLLDLLGLPPQPDLDGRSFKRVLTGEAPEHREHVVANWMEQGLVVRTKQHKLVFNHQPRDLDEVYDLTADPGELHNLAGTAAGQPLAADLFGRLDQWLKDTRHPYAEPTLGRRSVDLATQLCLAQPRVSAFRHLGGPKIELTYVWEVEQPLPYNADCWCFVQFVRPAGRGDQAIAFRNTTWPQPPTTAWTAGDRIAIGPLSLEIPAGVSGELTVRMGLYDPQAKTGPGLFVGPRAQGNSYELYRLRIERDGETITKVALVAE